MEKAQILIVEDDAIIAMDLESRMKKLGYGVTAIVGYGEQAIEKVKENTPDVVLMDIILKGEIDGIEAADAIRTQFDIPIIFITGYADKDRLKRAKLTYPFGFIIKPFQDKDLEVTIEMALYIAKVDAERRKAEKKLEESEKRFRITAEETGQLLYSFDPKTGKVKWAGAVEKVTGYTYEEYQSFDVDAWAEQIHPDDRKMVLKTMDEAVEHRTRFGAEYRFRRKDGSYIFVEEQGAFVLGSENAPYPTVGTISNITERKQTEEALRENEENYRLLANNIPGVVYKGYKDWSVYFFDEKIESLTGYNFDEFNSNRMKWNDIIVEEDIETARESFIQALKTDKSYVREYRIRSKTGDIFWIQERGHIVCDSKGEIEYVSGIFFDITERRQAEEDLRDSEKKSSV